MFTARSSSAARWVGARRAIRKVLLANAQVFPPVFIKGFVVIDVASQGPTPPTPPPPIDVVPVYTSHGFDIDASGVRTARGFSIDVERVPAVRKAF